MKSKLISTYITPLGVKKEKFSFPIFLKLCMKNAHKKFEQNFDASMQSTKCINL